MKQTLKRHVASLEKPIFKRRSKAVDFFPISKRLNFQIKWKLIAMDGGNRIIF